MVHVQKTEIPDGCQGKGVQRQSKGEGCEVHDQLVLSSLIG